MYYIQSGSGEFAGHYLMGFVGASPIWDKDRSSARLYKTLEEAEQAEHLLELHHFTCFIVPA